MMDNKTDRQNIILTKEKDNFTCRFELLKEIKDKFPDFPDFDSELKKVIENFPKFKIDSDMFSNTQGIPYEIVVLSKEIKEYKIRLGLVVDSTVFLSIDNYIDIQRLNNNQNVSLIKNYRVILNRNSYELIKERIKSLCRQYGIDNSLVLNSEISILDILKRAAIKVNQLTGFLPR